MNYVIQALEFEIAYRMWCVESHKANPYGFLVYFMWVNQQRGTAGNFP